MLLLSLASCGGGTPKSTSGTGKPRASSGKSGQTVESTPLAAAAGGGSFVKLSAEESGIDFENEVNQRELIVSQVATHSGVASGDIDGDGDMDLFFAGVNSGNRLYRNDGAMKFTDITAEAGADIGGGDKLGACAAFADLNNDGNLDLYVGNSDTGNDLYFGDGTGKFSEAPAGHGADDPRAATSTALFDADEDGDLDIYVCNYAMSTTAPSVLQSLIPQEGQKAVIPAHLQEELYVDEKGWPRHRPDRDSLLINDGNGRFTDVTAERGLDFVSFSFQAQAVDIDNDGDDDLYVTSDFETPDRALLNDGKGNFSLVTAEMFRKTALYGMGADSGDINNDGLPDLFVADMSARGKQRSKRQSGDMYEWRWEFMNQDPQPQMRNMLFVNTGDGWMSELASLAGLKSSDWTWATRFADMDCDGYEDLYTATGFTRDAMDVDTTNQIQAFVASGEDSTAIQDYIANQPVYRVQDYIFRNNGDLSFKSPDNNWGLTEDTYSAGASLADYDGDGDPDLIINYTFDKAGVFRNDISTSKRLSIDLVQEGGNPNAVGARVWAHLGEQVLSRDVIVSRGFASGESSRLHFGLGNAGRVDRLEIRWPDNKLQVVEGLDAGNHYTIHRSADLEDWKPAELDPLFETSELAWEQREINTAAVEYEKEPLLPWQMSTLGTGMALSDTDGDGLQELILGGAAGQDGVWLERDASGRWNDMGSNLAELVGREAEVTAIRVLDVDADGRRDLILATGGIEGNPLDGSFRNYLLLNLETGMRPKRLPTENTSVGQIAVADIDRDGDVDLLLCGHVRPYQFGLTDRSYLLVNDGSGNFSDAGELAPGLSNKGGIADALFEDMDGDGWQDLLVSRFWGPVELWLNIDGQLMYAEDLTENGWWRGLATGDFNRDGTPDVIACNFGENTKYHPSVERPQTTYCFDFDNNGSRDVVEATWNSDGTMLPGRGRSCSGYAIRTIPRRFPTWSQFSEASLRDVYGESLDEAEAFVCETVDSVVLLSRDGDWTPSPLPGMAQWTVAFSAAVADYDNDGNLDAFIAGNLEQAQPEAGQWDSGYGALLLGNGDGSFRSVSVPECGVRVYNDQRGSASADLDGDGNADLLLSISNGHPRVAMNRGSHSRGSGLNVVLMGGIGNPDGLGARLSLTLDDGSVLTRTAGDSTSYFASSTAPVHFGIPEGRSATSLSIRWADGSSQEVAVASGENRLEVMQGI
ncbi:VCBS repeat-containing protein [bacterium]|nr:VCBS repeat-containing protein [bacterium]